MLAVTVTPLLQAPASAAPVDSWWYDKLQVADAHRESTGKGIRIGIIDGAINLDAPDLQGADITLRKAVSQDKNGATRLVDARSFPSALYSGHGTAMTSLIVGQGKGNAAGGAGVQGIAPDAEVYFYGLNGNPDVDDKSDAVVNQLIEQAIKDKVDILSMSYSGFLDLDNELEELREADIPFVVGAGRPSGPIEEPASKRGVVAVGAITEQAKPWKKQPQGGGSLSIIAPGVDIASGIMRGTSSQAAWLSGKPRTGTSTSTALVSGALALVKSKYPDATGNQLIQSLIHNTGGRDFGWAPETGFGVVNLAEMLGQDPSGWPDENPLLLTPQQAIATYPQDSYGATPQTPAADDPAPSGSDDPSPAAASTSDDGGTSPWLLTGGAAALLVIVAGVLVARRRTTSSTPAQTGGTPHGSQ